MKKETLSNMRRNKPAETAAAKTPPYYREEVWNKLASLYDPLAVRKGSGRPLLISPILEKVSRCWMFALVQGH